jgi:hypothetical protein
LTFAARHKPLPAVCAGIACVWGPGNDEEISELPWRQAETKLATLIAQFGLPACTGRDGYSRRFGAA